MSDAPPADTITLAVEQVKHGLSDLLELIISRAAQQSASVVAPLIARQRAMERRLEEQAREIMDLNLRFDTRADQIDGQEERITALETRERAVGESS